MNAQIHTFPLLHCDGSTELAYSSCCSQMKVWKSNMQQKVKKMHHDFGLTADLTLRGLQQDQAGDYLLLLSTCLDIWITFKTFCYNYMPSIRIKQISGFTHISLSQ